MWIKTIFLVISLQAVLIASQTATISCNYRQIAANYPYTCDLTLVNPVGLDNFDRIQGEHLAGRNDSDVLLVSAYNQNSRLVPSVICRQFPNLRDLYLSSSNIININEAAFADCRNLENLMLSFNEISEVPDNTFRNNERLDLIYLSNNRIRLLTPSSFAGTRVQYLALGMNDLNAFNPAWFTPVNSTLETLEILANGITILPTMAFSNLRNLRYLDLTGNRFTTFPGDVFTGLDRLENIYISDCSFPQINPDWFTDLVSLDEFHYEFNGLSQLPAGVFAPLVRLRRLFLGSNNLTSFGVSAFGTNVAVLEVLGIDNNPIVSVEREFIVRARYLDTVALYRGTCFNSNIYNIQTSRSQAMTALEKCFANFGTEAARCRFAPDSSHQYSCDMDITNPFGNDFNSVAGEHLADREDSDVLSVIAYFQSTRNIPPVICRQFIGLRDLVVMSSFVELLSQQSFSECRALERLDLSYNEIATVDDNTFTNSPLLRELNLAYNRITRLNSNSFAGTRIRILGLSNNRLFEFSAEWDRPIESTLVELDLYRNFIQQIESTTFSNLRALTSLTLNNNFIISIADNAFSNITTLTRLALAGCNIRQLNPAWFAGLSNLIHLTISGNELTEFPENIFDSLTNLEDLYFFNNRIVELRADSFGASLPTIRTLYGSSNIINVFDPEILNRGTQLSSLLFYANLCTQLNIFDVRGNPELVRQQLSTCTDNFAAETRIACRYDRLITGRIYWCDLTVVNPSGRDDFERVEGNHLPGSNDDQVMYISSENQNTRVFPSVICNQFPSLQILDIINNNITELSDHTFGRCRFLREIILMGGNIRRIPDRAFTGSPNLLQLYLDNNGIRTISGTAFAGTQIQLLDLSMNEIHEFIPATYAAIGASLRILRLTDNRLESLPENAFATLNHLEDLELNHNHFFTLPLHIFNPLINLRILQVANCGIERIQPGLFSGLRSLVDLELALNDFDLLPENIFDLPNLHILGLDGNNLRVLDANMFGQSLRSLHTIDASLNRIAAFDPNVISENTTISNLNLAFNSCPGANFADIPANRQNVLNTLAECISTYNDVPISCTFTEDEAIYECLLTLDNVNDRLRFDRVSVDHMPNHNDNYVTHIRAISQNSRSIPSVLCSQFRNVEAIYFLTSNLEVVSSDALAGCQNLYSINLSGNNIIEIPDGAFRGNQYLSILNVASNLLSNLGPGIFQGTQVYYLDFENNRFREFNPAWFAPVASEMRYLIFRNNQIRRFPRDAFRSFPRLVNLEFSGNADIFVPSNAFEINTMLYDLEMANCGLMVLNPHWFKNLRFLNRLEVDLNGITELPHRVFDLPYLRILGIALNRIGTLDSRAFGSSLNRIERFDAEDNLINAIDRGILENSPQLSDLLLAGNTCTSSNFINVQDQLSTVMQALQGCFNNFDNL